MVGSVKQWVSAFLLTMTLAASVICAPVYCFGGQTKPTTEDKSHACCGSVEAPVDSEGSNDEDSSVGCSGCPFMSGEIDPKLADMNLVVPAASLIDLPLWLSPGKVAPKYERGLSLCRLVRWQKESSFPAAEIRARLCVFLI
ncbi:hypothetical protein [Ruficoccus sp. ZRK36]|uniref:hypothetical protein n=1 Tax=Ruficoccus sp. ZRK36 TaxID=2866311 RepID=UPI001C73D981|nr:hypothetical protein [Ruficoccus sp. ZRK36]QYY35501.1 hypothetical protein K0V07_14530 [Ruficoccus sp. ZRK36]